MLQNVKISRKDLFLDVLQVIYTRYKGSSTQKKPFIGSSR